MLAMCEEAVPVRQRQAILVLDPSPGSAARARRFTQDVLRPLRDTLSMDDLLLVVSELITNAVRYGEGGPTLTLQAAGGLVRVEVSDRGPLLPTGAGPSNEERGRGLHLIDALSVRWGIDPREPGKAIWAEIAT